MSELTIAEWMLTTLVGFVAWSVVVTGAALLLDRHFLRRGARAEAAREAAERERALRPIDPTGGAT